MHLFDKFKKRNKDTIVIDTLPMKDVNILISKIEDIAMYFPKENSILQNCIYELNTNDYSAELEDKIINKIVFEVFNNYRYIGSDSVVSDLGHLYGNVIKENEITNSVIYNEENDSYKVYDINIDESMQIDCVNNVYSNLLKEYFNSNISIQSILEKYRLSYENKLEDFKNKVKNANLEPYCGSIKFMSGRIDYIMNCMSEVINAEYVSDDIKNKFMVSYNNLIDERKVMDSNIIRTNNNYTKYELVEKFYKNILEVENMLSKYMEKIWNSYLTDPKDYKSGEPFRFLVHALTGGYVEGNKLNKVCCTLVTNNCMPIPYSDYGYVIPFNSDNIGTMCCEDAGSWVIDKERFINDLFPKSWQLYEKSGSSYVFYEYEKLSKLILPSEMEESIIRNNTKFFGHPLNKCDNYSEIFFQSNTKAIEPTAMFATNDEKLEYIDSIDDRLPKIEVDLNVYRQLVGLEPLDNNKHL